MFSAWLAARFSMATPPTPALSLRPSPGAGRRMTGASNPMSWPSDRPLPTCERGASSRRLTARPAITGRCGERASPHRVCPVGWGWRCSGGNSFGRAWTRISMLGAARPGRRWPFTLRTTWVRQVPTSSWATDYSMRFRVSRKLNWTSNTGAARTSKSSSLPSVSPLLGRWI